MAKRKNPAAVALGKLGGRKGGKARFAKLSDEERRKVQREAGAARWANMSEAEKAAHLRRMAAGRRRAAAARKRTKRTPK